jgi:pterin-4a-carbinolamine dehydratase
MSDENLTRPLTSLKSEPALKSERVQLVAPGSTPWIFEPASGTLRRAYSFTSHRAAVVFARDVTSFAEKEGEVARVRAEEEHRVVVSLPAVEQGGNSHLACSLDRLYGRES